MVVFVGLQASGKTTFFELRFASTHEHVSKDLFRHNKNKNRRQRQLIEEALRNGRPVVVDNTNPTPEERRLPVELAQEYGAKALGYYFEPDKRRSLEHNRRRSGKERVPDVAVYATAKKLIPPSYFEGFDELFRVRTGGDFKFEVVPIERGSV